MDPLVARGGVATAAGSAIVALVAAADLVTRADIALIGLAVLGPLVASLAASWRQTAAVAAFAWVTALAMGIVHDVALHRNHLIHLTMVSVGGALSAYAAAQREQRHAAMQRLTRVAELAQKVMLRPPPGVLGHIALAGRYVSASNEALVGGDLYETAFTPYGVRLIIGDVRGKGLDGIRLAANVLATFRESVWDRDLADLARTMDKRLTKEATDEEFVTVVLAEFPVDGGLSLVNCGHLSPMRLRSGKIEELTPTETTLPLGLAPEPRVEHYDFKVGDRLLLCTDGLTEGRDAHGAFFPLHDHTDALLVPGLQTALDTLLERLRSHTGGTLSDDLAILLAERQS